MSTENALIMKMTEIPSSSGNLISVNTSNSTNLAERLSHSVESANEELIKVRNEGEVLSNYRDSISASEGSRSSTTTLKERLSNSVESTNEEFIKVRNEGKALSNYRDSIFALENNIIGSGTQASTASQIDYDKVLEAYNVIKETAIRLNEISKKINAAGNYCTPNEFSVQGYSYMENVDECCNCFQYASKGLDEYADSLLSALNKTVNMQEAAEYENNRTNNNNNSNNNNNANANNNNNNNNNNKNNNNNNDKNNNNNNNNNRNNNNNNNNNNNKNNNNNGKIDINNLPDEQTLKKMIENGEIDQNTMKELEKLGKLPAPPKK